MNYLKPTTSVLSLRGLDHAIYQWGEPTAKPSLFFVHGWMDSGATVQFIAPYLAEQFHIISFDLRGFGNTQHVSSGYWYPEYYADLDALIKHFSPNEPVNLVGHSMGGNIASMYSGLRPNLVKKLMILDWAGLMDTSSKDTPERYRKWLNEVEKAEPSRVYRNHEELKRSMLVMNPSFSDEIIEHLIPLWAKPTGNGEELMLRADHSHRNTNPYRYNLGDALAVLDEITAPVAMVMASNSFFEKFSGYKERIASIKKALKVSEENYIVIPDSNHMLHIERPEQTSICIQRFFKS